MLVLLSPAKKLDESTPPHTPSLTDPALLADTERLMKKARKLKPADLSELMGISDNLANLNYERFQAFATPFTDENSRPAALTFAGDTYLGLDANTLSEDDLRWAQSRLVILSGLYGALRPLDRMQPYRLEMGTKLKTRSAPHLVGFWKKKVTNHLLKLLAEHDSKVLLNCASKEYFNAVDESKFTVIHPVFKERKEGKSRTISFFAKKARGMMARWMIETRAVSPASLSSFAGGGYELVDDSDPLRPVFERDQPPPVGG